MNIQTYKGRLADLTVFVQMLKMNHVYVRPCELRLLWSVWPCQGEKTRFIDAAEEPMQKDPAKKLNQTQRFVGMRRCREKRHILHNINGVFLLFLLKIVVKPGIKRGSLPMPSRMTHICSDARQSQWLPKLLSVFSVQFFTASGILSWDCISFHSIKSFI